jgi:hypothetical protein
MREATFVDLRLVIQRLKAVAGVCSSCLSRLDRVFGPALLLQLDVNEHTGPIAIGDGAVAGPVRQQSPGTVGAALLRHERMLEPIGNLTWFVPMVR